MFFIFLVGFTLVISLHLLIRAWPSLNAAAPAKRHERMLRTLRTISKRGHDR